MIVQTKYRDIPWEKYLECIQPEYYRNCNSNQWESNFRGKSIQILTPSVSGSHVWKCHGPFYALAGKEGKAVCPHIAEIGD